MVPKGGTEENSSWWRQQYQNLSQNAARQQKELEIRDEIRKWDEEIPWLHVDVIVRCAAGVLARGLVLSLYQSLRGRDRQYRR